MRTQFLAACSAALLLTNMLIHPVYAQDEGLWALVAEAQAQEGSIQAFIEQTEADGGDPLLELSLREMKHLEGEIAAAESLESLNVAGRSLAHNMSAAGLRIEEIYPTEALNDAVEVAGGWDVVAAIAVIEGYDLVVAEAVRQGYPMTVVPDSLRLLDMDEARAAAYTLRDIGLSGYLMGFGEVTLRGCDDDPEQECQQRKRECDDSCRNQQRLATVAWAAAGVACGAARALPPGPAKIAAAAACKTLTALAGAASARAAATCRRCRAMVCP